MWESFKYWCKNHDFQWKYKLTVCLPLFVFLVACDWGSKLGIQYGGYTQGAGGDFNWIPNFLGFNYTINPGAAGNMLAGNIALVISIAAVITLIAGVIFVFANDRMWLIMIVFIFSGSFANLIARAWAPVINNQYDTRFNGQHGGVIDFLYTNLFGWKYINNIADIWVSVGIILIVVFVIVELIKLVIESKHKSQEIEVEETATSINIPEVHEVKKQSKPRTYTDKELKAQAKLEKKMKKYEHKSK